MANVKISNLTAASTPVAGTEVLPIVQSGATVKVSIANLTPGLDTITAAKGGTGQTSYAVGDLLYASTTTALSKLADVATGNALISGGVNTAPSWGKIGLATHVSGTLPTANGGTNLTSFTANGVVYASSSSALTTGSALVFDGTNLGVGVTPSAWGGSFKAIQIGLGTSLYNNAGANGTFLGSNFYWDGTNNKYLNTNTATAYGQSAGAHAWYTAASGTAGANITFTQAMTLDASANLGVGVTSPTEKLHINGSILTTSNSSDFAKQGAQFDYITGGGEGWARINGYHSGGGSIYFYTNPVSGSPTERARIDSSGNLLVGATSTIANPRTVLYGGSGAGFIDLARAGTSLNDVMNFSNGNGAVGTIRTTGSSTQYNTSSDYRLKENILPMTGALAKVTALKPCTYTWKVDGESGEGFIAHELAEVCPGAVSGEKDAVNEDGSIKPQGIDTSFLVATLTAAIQELNAKFEEYKAAHP